MNNKVQTKTSVIQQGVMSKIRKGETHMKPQSFFLLIGALGALSIAFLGSIAAYFMSIATLWLRIQASQGPAYGAKQNMISLMGTFPWWALILGALSLACIIYLIKKTGSMYKLRLIYLIPSIISLFLIVGFLLSYSSVPEMFNSHRQNSRCINGETNCRPLSFRYIRNR